MSVETITDIIHRRRTINPKCFTDEPVPDAMVHRLLQNAHMAPNHRHTEPWRFRVYRGSARAALGDALADAYTRMTCAEAFKPKKAEKLRFVPRHAPVTISIGMARDPGETVPEIEEIAAVACAVQNMHLTATALGLGAKWSSPTFLYTGVMNDFFALGPDDRCLGLFYLGWPGIAWPDARRGDLDANVEWVGAPAELGSIDSGTTGATNERH
jgi:nitroreductase